MFVHVVLFWLDKNTPESVRDQMRKDAVECLKDIPTVAHVFAGKPVMAPDEIAGKSYHLGLCVVFQSSADHDAYQVHPLHRKYIAQYGQYWSKIESFDFQ